MSCTSAQVRPVPLCTSAPPYGEHCVREQSICAFVRTCAAICAEHLCRGMYGLPTLGPPDEEAGRKEPAQTHRSPHQVGATRQRPVLAGPIGGELMPRESEVQE
jgi:hypothetical protein